MTSGALYTLLVWCTPIAAFASALLLFASYYVSFAAHSTMRRRLAYTGLWIAGIAQCVTPIALVSNLDVAIPLVAHHAQAMIIMMACNAVSFFVFTLHAALLLRPRYEDNPAYAYYSMLPWELKRFVDDLTHRIPVRDDYEELRHEGMNDFMTHAMIESYRFVKPDRHNCFDGFIKGAAWASGVCDLLPDEVEWLRSQHADIEATQKALYLLFAYRSYSLMPHEEPYPDLNPHPNPVIPREDESELSEDEKEVLHYLLHFTDHLRKNELDKG
ncbi:hypothetical protein EJ419_05500 [Alloscardovia theropitheci]|uniref:Uncharacterized protein n=1 Tax=Alloscardovia theropitheci TaxID=2496842 RepID=A0A4R0QX43_9BIFI|nr:hypothetical protein [Alloscardovia theropitheci]TCD54110.1 hypothetical protein EJ419_05500 [Alloscardovia theropitheci]